MPRLPDRPLAAYLLGELSFDDLFALQRRLAFTHETGALIVCEHPPGITVGREGSRRHIRLSQNELNARQWAVRWVARGGGVMLHLPGQVAVYPLVPLAIVGQTPAEYVRRLTETVASVARQFAPETVIDGTTVTVRNRRIAHVGAAVRYGTTAFGAVLNATPDLDLFHGIYCDGDSRPMTSLARESPHQVRIPAVRQALVDAIAAAFGFTRVSVFHTLPATPVATTTHAVAYRR